MTRPECANLIGPSMPCAHLDCSPGEALVLYVPIGHTIRFTREVWRAGGRTWFEWVPAGFRRSDTIDAPRTATEHPHSERPPMTRS